MIYGLLDIAGVGLIYLVAAIVVTAPIWGTIWYVSNYRSQKRDADRFHALIKEHPTGIQDISIKHRFGMNRPGTFDGKRWEYAVGAYARFYPTEFHRYRLDGIL
ncbi:hypothetical protein [Burkholderia gladioli]|uniref:hypothetical protein n=1 Tax=Burkholderia gladioli TaxID=28095 RepID=UPI0016404C90|nr:hypothetical protein [Burkholderia gladioli]